MKRYTRQQVNAMIRADMRGLSARKYGEGLGVSQQYVSDVLAGKRLPGPALLNPLGLRVVRSITHVYEKVPR